MQEQIPYNLIMKYLNGESSEEEVDQVLQWRSINTDNEQEFLSIKATWEHSFSKASHFENMTSEALEEVMQITDASTTTKQLNSGSNFKMWIGIAASLILISTVAITYIKFQAISDPIMLEKVTGIDEKAFLKLEDGSQIWLNANSRLRYPKKFEDNIRKVVLEGEAFFDIAKNPDQPFVIQAQETITKVLGTAFNIRALKDEKEVSVIVTEGKVSFALETKSNDQVLLHAEDKGVIKKGEKKVMKEKHEDINALSWKTGKLIFDDLPLETIAIHLTRHYQKQVIVEDSTLAKASMNASFDNVTLPEVIEVIKASLNIRAIEQSNGSIVLKPLS